MSNQPKAKWTCDGENYWTVYVGTYRLCVCGKDGTWFVEHDDTDAPLAVTGKCGTPCDVVTLMLTAESTLATHLRSVADTMTWPDAPAEEPTVAIDVETHNTQYWNAGQIEIHVGGVKLSSGEISNVSFDQTEIYVGAKLTPIWITPKERVAEHVVGTWAWAKQQMYAGAQVCRRDHQPGPRVLECGDLGVFDNSEDHAASDWELVK